MHSITQYVETTTLYSKLSRLVLCLVDLNNISDIIVYSHGSQRFDGQKSSFCRSSWSPSYESLVKIQSIQEKIGRIGESIQVLVNWWWIDRWIDSTTSFENTRTHQVFEAGRILESFPTFWSFIDGQKRPSTVPQPPDLRVPKRYVPQHMQDSMLK